jgi:hypothetical protein
LIATRLVPVAKVHCLAGVNVDRALSSAGQRVRKVWHAGEEGGRNAAQEGWRNAGQSSQSALGLPHRVIEKDVAAELALLLCRRVHQLLE